MNFYLQMEDVVIDYDLTTVLVMLVAYQYNMATKKKKSTTKHLNKIFNELVLNFCE